MPPRAIGAASILLLALAGAPAARQEPRPEPPPLTGLAPETSDETARLAFVEIALARDAYLVHEPFRLSLRLGLERELLAHGLVPLFQRELELPVQVLAPWLGELPGARALPSEPAPDGPRLALGEAVVRARRVPDEVRGSATFAVFELERAFVAERPGTLELEAPLLRFAAATRFEDDFVSGRIALDRRELVVSGRPARLAVAPLPEAGRPPDFTGAIGRFALRATAEPRELVAGDGLALEVVVEGDGDLSAVVPPRLDDLDGFHVRGALAEHAPGRLVLRYDLAPRHAGVREVPPVRFAVFDPTPPAGYRTLASDPIPLVVRPAPADPTPDAAPETPDRWGALPLAALAVGVLLTLAAALGARRRG